MSVPYDSQFIARMLRAMPDDQFRAVTPGMFNIWPAKVATKPAVISELIAYETARRASPAA